MAISSPGIGSGLDVTGIVSQLMEIERQPLQQLEQKEAKIQSEISAYGALKNTMATLQASLDKLLDEATFEATSAASSDGEVLSVSSNTDALATSYDVTVNRLAQRHKLGSAEHSDSTTFGGLAGDELTISVETDSFIVDLSTAKTLDEIQQAINVDSNETGVTAGIITGDDGNQTLVLTASDSGYEKRVQLAYGGSINASTFAFSSTNRDVDGNLLDSDTELDAALVIDGVSVTRGSNTVDDVVQGLTIELAGTGRATVSISRDPAAVSNAVNDFINGYNNLQSQLSVLSEGSLSGNGILIGIELRVRGVLNGAVTGLGDISYISQLGVTTNEAGRLQLDEATLTSALKENRDSVIGFFSAESGGFATRLDTILGGFLDSGGVMDGVLDGANRRVDDIGQSRDSLERRMESIEQRYRDQFTALDTLISGLTATSDYLTGQLEQLSNLTNYYRDR